MNFNNPNANPSNFGNRYLPNNTNYSTGKYHTTIVDAVSIV